MERPKSFAHIPTLATLAILGVSCEEKPPEMTPEILQELESIESLILAVVENCKKTESDLAPGESLRYSDKEDDTISILRKTESDEEHPFSVFRTCGSYRDRQSSTRMTSYLHASLRDNEEKKPEMTTEIGVFGTNDNSMWADLIGQVAIDDDTENPGWERGFHKPEQHHKVTLPDFCADTNFSSRCGFYSDSVRERWRRYFIVMGYLIDMDDAISRSIYHHRPQDRRGL